MSVHKRIKFPVDMSQAKAKDMYKLKFIRKSEMEPTVRHHLKHAVSQMDKQVDVWFKEQTFTIGTISKQQDKLSQSRTRLKKEQRRIKKKDYARKQEEIRSKLHALRLRIMLRKAVQKFKANVVKAREYRNAELGKLGPNVRLSVSDDITIANEPDSGKDVVTVNRSHENVLIGMQRFPSSGGRQMEPIPEEEVEIELNEIAEKPRQRLTKKRLHQLNRTISTRSVLDLNATVPLLPDLAARSNLVRRKSRLKDTDDKQTQTSLESERTRSPDTSDLTDRSEKKTKSIVVKLPIATRSPQFTRTPRSDSFKSGKSSKSLRASIRGARGSDSEFSGDDSDTDDNSNASVTNSVSGGEYWDNTSDSESSYTEEEFIPDEVSLTLTKYKTKDKTKRLHSKETSEAHPHRQTFPDERMFPELSALSDSKHRQIQNPYLSLYKERSFYIEPKSKERLAGNATDNKLSSKDDLYVNNGKTEKHRDKLDDINGDLSRNNSLVNMDETAKDMAVFGKKADYNSRKMNKTPPNTPASHTSTVKRTSRSQLSVVLMNKKRAQSLDKHRSSPDLEDEPFQRYERSKTGKLQPLGSPRSYHAELPSMKDRYKRDKLLKIERDSQLNQDMKMRRFFSSFDKDQFDLSTSSSHPSTQLTPLPNGHSRTKSKAFTNFVFKIYRSEGEDSYPQKEIVPKAETTSVRLLKNCRYLREYKPVAENSISAGERETSWEMKTSSKYTDRYLANVRLKLF